MSKYTALAVVARASPTDRLQGDFRTEWDPTFHTLRTLAANGAINSGNLQASAGWSRRRFIPGLPGFDNENFADHYLNASANWHTRTNTVGVTYSFNYDLKRDSFLQQRYLAYYNAQCCGFGVEYQAFNFANFSRRGHPAGSPLQHLVHAGRNRHVLEFSRRLRRAGVAMRHNPGDWTLRMSMDRPW